MKINSIGLAVAAVSLGTLSGCASPSSRRGYSEVSEQVGTRVNANLPDEGDAKLAVKEKTQAILKELLTADGAVQLAFLNNAGLRARLEDIGVAQADMAQSGILENPNLHFALRFPSGGGATQTGREFGVTEDFLSLLSLPLSRRMASSQFQAAKFRLSHEVLSFAAEVKEAFYNYQAALGRQQARETALETLTAAGKLLSGQRGAGNISRLDLIREQAAYEEAKLELSHERAEAAVARERLALFMGVQDMGDWKVEAEAASLPAADPPLAGLESEALNRRWDLAAARQEPAVLEQAMRVSRLGAIGGLAIGFDSEKDLDGKFGIGPAVEWKVPIFDRRQADRARLTARTRQSEAAIGALSAQIRFEVRSAYTELDTARAAVQSYDQSLIPLRAGIVDESLKRYNFMLLGVYQLLEAKRDELAAVRGRIDAMKDYWIAAAHLERAVGGKMTAVVQEKTEGGKP